MSVSARFPEVVVPLVAELIPCPDPWAVARKLSHLPHLLFLDSAEKHTDRGRYSYIMADPLLWIEHDVKGAHGDDPFEIIDIAEHWDVTNDLTAIPDRGRQDTDRPDLSHRAAFDRAQQHLGVAAYLRKPIDPDVLLMAVNRIGATL